VLEIRDLTKVYPAQANSTAPPLVVMDRITFTVPDNQFVCLLGPSGCGKSTLIRMVVGITEPDGGEILVAGVPVRRPGPDRCIFFQNYGLLPWRTVMANVELGLEIAHVPVRERRKIAQECIDKVGLHGFESS